MKGFIDNAAYVFDELKITRRLSIYITLYLVVITAQDAWSFAKTSELDGLAIAAVIAAVTAPLSALMGFTLKFHFDGHKDDG